MAEIVFVCAEDYYFLFDSIESFRKRIIPLLLSLPKELELENVPSPNIIPRLEQQRIFFDGALYRIYYESATRILYWTFRSDAMAQRVFPIITHELQYYSIIQQLVQKEHIQDYSEIELYREIPKDYKLAITPDERNVYLIVNEICVPMSWENYTVGWMERPCQCLETDCEVCMEYNSRLPPFEMAQQVFQDLGIAYDRQADDYIHEMNNFQCIILTYEGKKILPDMKYISNKYGLARPILPIRPIISPHMRHFRPAPPLYSFR